MIILDTNVLSAAMSADTSIIAWLDRQPRASVWTTAVTLLEIRFGLEIMPSGRRKADREAARREGATRVRNGEVPSLDGFRDRLAEIQIREMEKNIQERDANGPD